MINFSEQTTARNDFRVMARELGVSEAQIREQSFDTSNMVYLPRGKYQFEVRPSLVEGSGIMTTRDFVSGELICPARVHTKRTEGGRYTNHSPKPNAIVCEDTIGDVMLVATARIGRGEEVFIDYRQSFFLVHAMARKLSNGNENRCG